MLSTSHTHTHTHRHTHTHAHTHTHNRALCAFFSFLNSFQRSLSPEERRSIERLWCVDTLFFVGVSFLWVFLCYVPKRFVEVKPPPQKKKTGQGVPMFTRFAHTHPGFVSPPRLNVSVCLCVSLCVSVCLCVSLCLRACPCTRLAFVRVCFWFCFAHGCVAR